MKKTLLYLTLMTFLSVGSLRSQCVPTCSSYAASPITYTVYPAAGINAIPLFSPSGDDGYTSPVPIGFNFNFYCTTYTSVLVYSNGLIQFDIGAPSTFPLGYDAAQFIPDPSSPTVLNGIVAFRMDDLDPSVGGTITYTTLGISPNQMFVVTYSNVPVYGTSILQSGQIVLHETTNNIDIISIDAPSSPNLATQGIENALGTLATATPGRNQSLWSATASAYRFYPYTPAPPTSITGSATVCQGVPSFYQATFLTGATNYNWTLPSGWSGTSTISALTATTGATGAISVTATYSCGTSVPAVINVTVNPAPHVAISVTPGIVCAGRTVTLNVSGAVNYNIEPGSINGVPTFTDLAYTTTVYTLTGTNAQGCSSFNNPTATLIVNDVPVVSVNSGTVCDGKTFSITPSGATSYVITNGFYNVTPTVGVYSYSVVGTGTNGCISTPAVSSLTVYALPSIGATASRSVFCRKESSVLTATGAVSYTWSTGSASPTLTVSPTTNTFYLITGTDARGCMNTGTLNLTVNACTGIDEFSGSAGEIRLYPNPTTGAFEIKLPSTGDKPSIEIFNALGKLILTASPVNEAVNVDLKSYSSGLYYVKVKTADGEKTIKVIKQ